MKKIEKLWMYVPEIEKSHYVAILNIANKLDEVIEAFNQSQKQPEEEEVSEMYDFNERKITTYIVDENKVITILRQDEMPEWLKKGDIRVFKDTPEKQEETESDVQEWREKREYEIYKILYDKSSVKFGVRVLYEEDFPLEELADYISQLLSEEYFRGVKEGTEGKFCEKQEEWREELDLFIKDNLWAWVCPDCDGGGANGSRICKTCKGRGVYKWETELLLEEVSQLLSERTREAKQEVIDDIWGEARGLASWTEHDGSVGIGDVETNLPEAIDNVESKLLKEYNGDRR